MTTQARHNASRKEIVMKEYIVIWSDGGHERFSYPVTWEIDDVKNHLSTLGVVASINAI